MRIWNLTVGLGGLSLFWLCGSCREQPAETELSADVERQLEATGAAINHRAIGEELVKVFESLLDEVEEIESEEDLLGAVEVVEDVPVQLEAIVAKAMVLGKPDAELAEEVARHFNSNLERIMIELSALLASNSKIAQTTDHMLLIKALQRSDEKMVEILASLHSLYPQISLEHAGADGSSL